MESTVHRRQPPGAGAGDPPGRRRLIRQRRDRRRSRWSRRTCAGTTRTASCAWRATCSSSTRGGWTRRPSPTPIRTRGSTLIIDGRHGFGQVASRLAVTELTPCTHQYGVASAAVRDAQPRRPARRVGRGARRRRASSRWRSATPTRRWRRSAARSGGSAPTRSRGPRRERARRSVGDGLVDGDDGRGQGRGGTRARRVGPRRRAGRRRRRAVQRPRGVLRRRRAAAVRRPQGLGPERDDPDRRRRARRHRRLRRRRRGRQRDGGDRARPDRVHRGLRARGVDALCEALAGDGVLVPGEIEQRTRAQRVRDGIPLPADTWSELQGLKGGARA